MRMYRYINVVHSNSYQLPNFQVSLTGNLPPHLSAGRESQDTCKYGNWQIILRDEGEKETKYQFLNASWQLSCKNIWDVYLQGNLITAEIDLEDK